MTDTQPPVLPADLLEQLAAVGNKAVNDYWHEDLCHCSAWPESCRHYPAGNWDTPAFDIALPAIIAAHEQTRAAQPDPDVLQYAVQYRLPLTNTAGGYGEVAIERGAGDYRDLWAVTDGSLTRLRAWTEPDGWQYITDIGWAAAYRHALDQAFELGRRVVEIESACIEAEISAIAENN